MYDHFLENYVFKTKDVNIFYTKFKRFRHKILYSYYIEIIKNNVWTGWVSQLFSDKNIMVQIKSNTKQYFLSFLGVNFKYFKTVSIGKILSKLGVQTKASKKSKKFIKFLVDFFGKELKIKNFSYTYYWLKPMNKKNFNLWFLFIEKYKINFLSWGGSHYRKLTTKKVARIKKRIKKKLLKNFTNYSNPN